MKDNQPIEATARELFERANHQLDPVTANHLRQSRRNALFAPAGRVPRFVPLLAATCLLVLGVAWWLPRPATAPIPAGNAAIESDEDSDIYAWLDDAPVAPDSHAGESL